MAINNASGAIKEQSFSQCSIPKKTSLAANTAKVILDVNVLRMYAAIVNYSNQPVTLVLGEQNDTVIDKGIPLLPYGTYEINSNNLYRGKVSAISAATSDVVSFECIK